MVALDRLPTPSELVAHLDRHVVGQAEAKRALASAVYRHYLGLAHRDLPGSGDRDFGRQHVLLFGPTGCGKTLLVRVLARHLGVPVAFTAATTLVETGYSGEHVDSVFAALLAAAGGDPARAERGIVFLDEFDKLRRVAGHGRDVSGEGVQNALLAALDGAPVRLKVRDTVVTLDASRVLFVCAGAFAALAPQVRARLASGGAIGFASVPRDEPLTDADALARVTAHDLVEFGLVPELVGRFPWVASLRPLGRPDLVRILDQPDDGPLAREARQFELHGVRLEVLAEAREALAARALAMGTGARGLPRLLHETLAPVAWRLPELADEGVSEVRVYRATVEHGAAPELRHGGDGPPPLADELRHAALAPLSPEEARARRLREELARLNGEESARRQAALEAELGYGQLGMADQAAWHEYRTAEGVTQALWVLTRLRGGGWSLAAFATALRAARHAPPEALLHYAAYAHVVSKAEEARRRREARLARRRPRPRGGESDAPRLDV